MILQALNQFYERVASDEQERDAYNLPTPGYSTQNITFCIVLTPAGQLHDIEDIRQQVEIPSKSKKAKPKINLVPHAMLVPGQAKPSGSGLNPCTLWDNSSYLLGYKSPDKNPTKAEKDSARAREAFEKSREHHLALEKEIGDVEFSAVCRFLEQWNPEQALGYKEKLDDFATTGFGVFKIMGETHYAHEKAAFMQWWAKSLTTPDNSAETGICLITGEESPLARLHEPAIKGVAGAAPGGAKLASFNQNVFESYGKTQSYNSPVSEKAAFQYCNALNALLNSKESDRHRMQIGNVTTLFWAERRSAFENSLMAFISGRTEGESYTWEDDDQQTKNLRLFMDFLRNSGGAQFSEIEDGGSDSRYYILGLTGNVTRLVVRYWHVSTLQELAQRMRAHFAALAIHRREHEPEFPATWRLLGETVRERKDIPENLSAALTQAILTGTPYPQSFHNALINRIRADHQINYLRAASFKAILTRKNIFNPQIAMSLDTERTEPAYLLGRLFAVLEKTQADGINTETLRERYYSSASATPSAVFPRLLRLYQHHLNKLEGGYKINREKLVQSIHASLHDYPKHLNLDEQGLFAIGYYHQRQDFFTKKTNLTLNTKPFHKTNPLSKTIS